jgi:hypothetical protein
MNGASIGYERFQIRSGAECVGMIALKALVPAGWVVLTNGMTERRDKDELHVNA